ncbi:30S ribosomal protein S14 [Rhodococcus sp. PAMC28707]|nr:30S ribosomal protein S14 [Rhodococcus sp. PAMC28705]QCB58001.1 30S ribosomal protein S14 [Rhodococcus sp. PAMC28707]
MTIITKSSSHDSGSTETRVALQRLPRASSPVRLRNRDAADGPPRGYLRKCGLSRIDMCEPARREELHGVHKSSW